MVKMSLKNLILLVLSVSLVIGVALTGCVGNETATPPRIPNQEIPTYTSNEAETSKQELPTSTDNKTETPSQQTPTQITKDITPQEAFALIQNNQNNPDFVIIDVRTPQEFAEEHIENALNIDYYSETFRDELNKLDKNKTYLVYCRSGSRSRNALNIMKEPNFREAYNILGGINQWKAEGFELKTEGAKSQTDVLEWKREEIPTQMK